MKTTKMYSLQLLDETRTKNRVSPPGVWMFCDFKFQIFLVDQCGGKKWDLFVRCSLFLSHYLVKIGEIKHKN